ncbi:HypC/HybG/HupF family hydrogenase formation chaperone [Candidatus Falkowbacteria bacterium]|jgi:hydrogenase assembly chaperone HypC/HupF|nr:HypC/HybG/HupF family hydrogenase formation chaperone [Candidatus Falkowbacteria bacterium]MBT5503811.1 HypC/HybG/HupF family hydrogenase formation chaperone [Candidatus Falkowbacteria bacterium]MBT6573864.1 HypC/HybG/HupF family hydrogenase formation chaperone [Candidatus Falkowbacteria bacterium]MBT7348554.1 HypC/HybG/HupF family hydrogenase formation chaperone [Candidatus Falkowbacteria bacterium]MBT7501062.1 HypC/HybG/HupF family hydrogenase formation chaperone [Candidatus Falkowbacteria
MCLTIPHKIIRLNDQVAIVKTAKQGEKQVSVAALSDLKIGDWVLVNANIAVQKIDAAEAKEINKMLI